MQSPPDTLIITRRDIAGVMTPGDFLNAAEQAFRAAASGRASAPPPMHVAASRGVFHAKGGGILLDKEYVAIKINANFPGNPAELGLPTIQGAVVLADGSNGVILAILDSIEVTLRRTAAASALAAKLLALPDSRTLLVCGCGEQGRAHLVALSEVLPFKICLVWDRDYDIACALAAEPQGAIDGEIIAVRDLSCASISADVIATCTTAREPFLELEMVKPGTFIAAVGADNPDKSEISPRLMAAATVITDVHRQCIEMGDLHHAISRKFMVEEDVHAELGEVVVAAKPGRQSRDDIVIFDSTGTGLQDVAASAVIYERCQARDAVRSVALAQ